MYKGAPTVVVFTPACPAKPWRSMGPLGGGANMRNALSFPNGRGPGAPIFSQ